MHKHRPEQAEGAGQIGGPTQRGGDLAALHTNDAEDALGHHKSSRRAGGSPPLGPSLRPALAAALPIFGVKPAMILR
ncbi:hypothetical protein [Yoonia sp. BS5-3]|uniref:Uncharacterized protein n=1 Tax=Yoonia phaeophyticola TaxID=3137369 RepID=A0ABZ2V004_9RHOB